MPRIEEWRSTGFVNLWLTDSSFTSAGYQVAAQAEVCNDRKFEAKAAQEDSGKLFMNVLIYKQGPLMEKATIFRVLDRSFDVLIDRLAQEVRIYYEQLTAEVVSIDETAQYVGPQESGY